AVMTATLSMVPVAQIRPSKANPRAEFDDERMAELIESVKRHGIISPLTLSRDGDGRYAIIAGERRYRAAKAAKLREAPAQVGEVLSAEWLDDQGKPLHAVAYGVGGYYGPITPRGGGRVDAVAAVLAKLRTHAEAVEEAYQALPEIKHAAEYDWQAREQEERR